MTIADFHIFLFFNSKRLARTRGYGATSLMRKRVAVVLTLRGILNDDRYSTAGEMAREVRAITGLLFGLTQEHGSILAIRARPGFAVVGDQSSEHSFEPFVLGS